MMTRNTDSGFSHTWVQVRDQPISGWLTLGKLFAELHFSQL